MTDSKGNKIKVGDVVAVDPFTVLVVKIENGLVYLGREGWEKRMMPEETENDMLVKLTQEEMTKSFWVVQKSKK